ncbi:hypothetical protein WDW89_16635 [Deltaproteobacteria bacterium TL4]
MKDQTLLDFQGRKIRFTAERQEHISQFHPEMEEQLIRIPEILQNPEKVVQSKSDSEVEMYYHFYQKYPVPIQGLEHCFSLKRLSFNARLSHKKKIVFQKDRKLS